MGERPRIPDDPMYRILQEEKVNEFNARRATGTSCSLTNVDLRGLDLRHLNADGLDFTGSYFRGADLRGIDFRNAILEGVSFMAAKISGCYFPKELRAEEIMASVNHGIRVRYNS